MKSSGCSWKRILAGRGPSVMCYVLRKWESADDARHLEGEGGVLFTAKYKKIGGLVFL